MKAAAVASMRSSPCHALCGASWTTRRKPWPPSMRTPRNARPYPGRDVGEDLDLAARLRNGRGLRRRSNGPAQRELSLDATSGGRAGRACPRSRAAVRAAGQLLARSAWDLPGAPAYDLQRGPGLSPGLSARPGTGRGPFGTGSGADRRLRPWMVRDRLCERGAERRAGDAEDLNEAQGFLTRTS